MSIRNVYLAFLGLLSVAFVGCTEGEVSFQVSEDTLQSNPASSYSGSWISESGSQKVRLSWLPVRDAIGAVVKEYYVYRYPSTSVCPAAESVVSQGLRIAAVTIAGTEPLVVFDDVAGNVYSWVSGASGSTNNCYIIRAVGPAGEDTSNTTVVSVSSLVGLSVQALNTPLRGGSSTTIRWNFSSEVVSDSDRFTIEYSLDGSTWNVIDEVAALAGPLVNQEFTLNWNIPAVNASAAKIRVTFGAVGNSGMSSVSAPFVIDSTGPVLSLQNPPATLRGGATFSVDYFATDVLSDIAGLVLEYAADGVTFGGSVALSASATSENWTVPTDNSSTAKLRLVAEDAAGNTSTIVSSVFVVDSTGPAAPAVTLASAAVTSSTTVALTVASCDDRSAIFVNEGTRPAQDASGWQNCLTDVGAITYTINPATNGSHSLKVWAKDSVGNVSTDPGTVTVVYDTVAPVMTFGALSAPWKNGNTATISWTVTELNAVAAQSFSVQVSQDNGNTWGAAGTVLGADGPMSSRSFSYNWAVPAWNTNQARVRVLYSDQAGNSATLTSDAFTVDSTAPVLSAGQMNLNSGDVTTGNTYVQVALKASDTLSHVSHFCLKYNTTVSPTISDSCWIAVNAPSPGLVPGLSLNLSAFSFPLGLSAGTYTVYAWVRDKAGNISVLSAAGAGTDGLDRDAIDYQPGTPPVVTNVMATSTNTPSSPPSSSDLTAVLGSSVYIKWNVTDDGVLPAGPISLYYTTDDTHYILIAEGIENAPGSGCTIVPGTHTGCYTWTNNVTSFYFRIRVTAQDSNSMVTYASSSPLNVLPPIRFLAGNTDPGLNGSAASAVFFNELTMNSALPDPGTLVVTSSGRIYFRDFYRGILVIDPSDGVQKVLIPTTGVSSGDGGNASSATLRRPDKIALDYQDNLYVFDYDRIRKINTATMQIETIIGGGASSLDVMADPLSLKIDPVIMYPIKRILFVILPNGDIIFQAELHELPHLKIRHYHRATNTVTSIYLTGTGDHLDATRDIDECAIRNIGIQFDPLTSAIQAIDAILLGNSQPGCTLAPATVSNVRMGPDGISVGPHPLGGGDLGFKITSRSGEPYIVDRYSGRINKYNPSTRTFTMLIGTGSPGTCADGTLATSCSIDPQDAFITAQGKIYFMDRGRIRTLDDEGRVRTLMGQAFSFGDGGHPLSARFNVINDVQLWNDGTNDKFIVLDQLEDRFREFSIDGTISTIAGNGKNELPSTAVAANAQGIYLMDAGQFWDVFSVNPTDGSVYFNRGRQRIARLNRNTGLWEDLVGHGAAIPYYYDPTADGLLGNQIGIPSVNYPPIVIGSNGTQILSSLYRHDGVNYRDALLKLFTTAQGLQSHLAGVAGVAADTFCAIGTAAASCAVPRGMATSYTHAHYDTFSGKWLMMQVAAYSMKAMAPGGSMEELTSLSQRAASFAYRRNADLSTHLVYYCNYTDGKIWKKDLVSGVDADLAWPVASMRCTGRSLIWNAARNSLIFPYKQNNMYGIAEYENP